MPSFWSGVAKHSAMRSIDKFMGAQIFSNRESSDYRAVMPNGRTGPDRQFDDGAFFKPHALFSGQGVFDCQLAQNAVANLVGVSPGHHDAFDVANGQKIGI